MKKQLSMLLLLAGTATSGYAGVFGPLANFDVVNDTGKVAHGFEIDIDGITPSQITSLFGDANRWPGMERYGVPVVTTTATGVKVVYQATNNGGWSAGTPSGTLPVSPSDSCWPLGAKAYGPNYPCDHFGVSTSVNTPNVTYSWLVETAPGASTLTPVQATVPNPVWTVVPAQIVNNVPQPPQVNVVIAAPQPNFYEFGEARWVKVSATGLLQNVAVEDLVAENAVIKQAQTQVQVEWQLLQVDSGSPGSGQIDLTGVALDPGAKSIVYRFEFYKYTGYHDPQTYEAISINGDTSTPAASDLGQFIVAQNAGVNFDGVIPPAPPLPIAPSLNASINGVLIGKPYNQVITATPGNAGDTLTFAVTGLPAGLSVSGNAIVGTTGAAVGTYPITITVTDTANGLSTTGTTNITVSDAAIVFPSPFSLAAGSVGSSYTQALSVTGGYPPITFADPLNTLPAGLSISGSSITGIPTKTGTYTVQIQAKDSLGYSQSASGTLVVAAGGGNPAPTPCSGSNAIVSSVSGTQVLIAGGVAAGGETLDISKATVKYVAPATKVLANELVTFSGTLNASNVCAVSTVTVAPGLSLTKVTWPAAKVGTPFTATAVTPAGGVAPYTISVGGLPNGLSFSGTSITGTPLLGANGKATVSISVNDSNSPAQTVNTTSTLTVNPAPVISLGAVTLPTTGSTTAAYTGSVKASGGVGALTWTASGLPAGVTISAGGLISGTPTAAGVYTPVLTVTDSIGQVKTKTGTITVKAPIVINSTLPTTGKVGVAYSANETATGGYGAFTWTATGLPTGVSIAPNGVISGSPTTAGTYKATLTVTDALKTTATLKGTVVIAK